MRSTPPRRLAATLAAVVGLVALALPTIELTTAVPSGASSNWTATTGIDAPGVSDGQLNAVSCVASDQCLAAGYGYGTEFETEAAQLAAGGTWTSSTVDLAAGEVDLESVSCLSASWCMAVGWWEDDADAYHLVAATWSDGSWTMNAALAATRYTYPANAELTSVSCTSETSCVAVGYTDSSAYEYYSQPLVLSLTGSTWSTVAISYDPSLAYGSLSAVSCADASDCAAVGSYYSTADNTDESLAVTETAGTWTVVDGLENSGYESSSYLDGVSCPAAGQCEAVGGYTDPDYDDDWVLVGSLDGTNWTPDYSEQPGDAYYTTDVDLASVSCPAVGSCLAVGTDQSVPLLETLSGGSWSSQTVPVGEYGSLSSVSCSADLACEAVGETEANYYSYSSLAISGTLPPTLSGPTTETIAQGSEATLTYSANGVGPVTIDEEGALPSGMTFTDSETGTGTDTATLSGVPGPFTGDYPFTIVAVDGNGNTTSLEVDLTVTPLGPNPPIVTGLSPDVTGAGGGTKVTVKGANFTHVLAVLFDGTPAVTFTVKSAKSIVAVAPPAPSGGTTYPSVRARIAHPALYGEGEGVIVVTSEGASAPALGSEFYYAAPQATFVTPASGVGGQTVAVLGTFLSGVTSVTFDGVDATNVKVNAAGTGLTAVAPYGVDGTVWVSVTTGTGTSYTEDDFTFDPPAITAVKPNHGYYDDTPTVTITGTDLTDAYQVYFGDIPANSFTENADDTEITATVPPGFTGTVDTRVWCDDGITPVVAADQYKVTPGTVLGVYPSSAVPGSLVTVVGAGLTGAYSVWFGSVETSDIYYATPTYFTVRVPVNPGASTVEIRVTNPAGTSTGSVAGQFVYG